jgi:Zn finger protein HypA/HybF involved in hydrogenase expression
MSVLGGRPDKLPEKEIHNEEVEGPCPQCRTAVIIWKERILLEGSLEHYHLMHTEVNDVYECPSCHHKWEEFRYL